MVRLKITGNLGTIDAARLQLNAADFRQDTEVEVKDDVADKLLGLRIAAVMPDEPVITGRRRRGRPAKGGGEETAEMVAATAETTQGAPEETGGEEKQQPHFSEPEA